MNKKKKKKEASAFWFATTFHTFKLLMCSSSSKVILFTYICGKNISSQHRENVITWKSRVNTSIMSTFVLVSSLDTTSPREQKL